MWYLVLSRTLKHGDAKQPHYDAHREWLEAQHRAGRALFSGPSTDDQPLWIRPPPCSCRSCSRGPGR